MHLIFSHSLFGFARSLPLLCALLLISVSSQAQINKIFPEAGTSATIRKISFYSSTEGFAAFDGNVAFSVDGGKSWNSRPVTANNVNFRSYPVNGLIRFEADGVHAIDQQHFLVYGSYGYANAVLYSADNGATYTLVFYSLAQHQTDQFMIRDLKMAGNNIVFAVDHDRIMRSLDNGFNWDIIRSDPGNKFFSISAIGSNVFVFGVNKILRSSNAGDSWVSLNTPGLVRSGFFLNTQEGWLCAESADGQTQGIYKTTDGGVNWTLISNAGQVYMPDVMYFLNNQSGFAFDSYHNVALKTSDGGKFWEKLLIEGTPRPFTFYDLFVLNSTHLWIAGNDALYSSSNGGGTGLPVASFKIDTAGYASTATVHLINYSNPAYSFKWFRNGVQFSTDYQSSYTRNGYPVKDTITLIVANSAAKDTLSLYQEFHPPVELISFTPGAGAKGHLITLTGKNFKDVLSVSFGGQPALSFTVISETTIQALVNEGASGAVSVTTRNGGTASLTGFSFLPPPGFTSFNPTTSIAGNTLTLTGTNFLEVESVRIGGVLAPFFTVVNSNTIQVTVPSGGSGTVKVFLKAGTVELPGFVAIPSITSFTPDRDTEAGALRIRGTSFTDVTNVSVGGVEVQSFRIVDADNIIASFGKGASGAVLVTAPGGQATRAGFTYLPSPVITAFSPSSGPVGTLVTITGTNFDPAPANNIVAFGAVKANVKTASSNSLTVEVPAGASFSPLSVQTRNLTAWASSPFMVTFSGGSYPAPNSFDRYIIESEAIRYFSMHLFTDLDGDGKPDLVAKTDGQNEGALTMFRNNSTPGQLSFAAPSYFKVGFISALSAGDMDNDGKTDIIVLKENGTILIYSNNSTSGNIGFKEPIIYTANASAFIHIADIDKDGKLDILTRIENKLGLIRNINQSGQLDFETPLLLDIPFKSFPADMDLDGDIDLLVQNPDNTGSLFLNESTPGKVHFTKGAGFPVSGNAGFQTADMNGDGRPDIVVNENNTSDPVITVNIMLNKSSSSGPVFEAPFELSATTDVYGMALVDIDGDGKTDIATSNPDTDLATYHNRTTGGQLTFSGRVVYGERNVHRGWFNIGANDLDGDGMVDIFSVSNREDDDQRQLIIYRNNSVPKPYIGSFTPVGAVNGTTVTIKGYHFNGTTSVKFGGVNAKSFTIVNDSLISAIPGSGATGDITVINAAGEHSRSGFTYGVAPRIQSLSPAAGPVGSEVVITGSGFNSNPGDNLVRFGGALASITSASSTQLTVIVPANASPGPVTVMNNRLIAYSSREFTVTFPGDTSKLRETSFVRGNFHFSKYSNIADIDNDGKQDLVMIGPAGDLQVAKNTSQPGSISFATPVAIATKQPGVKAATADLDGDSKTDVVILHESLNSFEYRKNSSTTSNISFDVADKIMYKVQQNSAFNHIRAHDVDGDGRPDIVISNFATHSLYYFKNLSDASGIRFAPVYILRVAYPKDLRITDIDNDGISEILVASHNVGMQDGTVVVFKHLPYASIINFTQYKLLTYSSGENLTYTDLDGDGRSDLLSGGGNVKQIYLGKNMSSIGDPYIVNTPVPFPITDYSRFISPGDLNGDGRPDIIVGGMNYLTFLKNQSAIGEFKFDTTYQEWLSVSNARAILADLDGDGVLDFATDAGGALIPFRNTLGDITIKKICKSSNATLEAGISGSIYQWQRNTGNGFINLQASESISGVDQSKLELKQVPVEWNDHRFRCIVDGKEGRSFKLLVDGNILTPTVSIQLSESEICKGGQVTAYTTLTNAGASPAFKWEVNGVDKNLNLKDYTTGALTSDAIIRVTVISSEACVTSTTAVSEAIVKVKQPITPTASIDASKNNICSGEEVVFTAQIPDGLTAVSYHWKKNDQAVGNNSNTYKDTQFTSDDELKVAVEFQPVCSGGNYAESPVKKIIAKYPKNPVIRIGYTNADADYINNVFTVRTQVENIEAVQSYQWMDSTRLHGWHEIEGATGASIVYSPATTGDRLKCKSVVVRNCGNEIATIESEPYTWSTLNKSPHVSPNPVRDILYIDELNPNNNWQKLEIVSLASGMKVMELDPRGKNSISVAASQLPPGNYIVVLRSPSVPSVRIRFIKL